MKLRSCRIDFFLSLKIPVSSKKKLEDSFDAVVFTTLGGSSLFPTPSVACLISKGSSWRMSFLQRSS